MARAYHSDVLQDEAGNVLVNALGTLYTDSGATVAVSDAFNAGSGGSAITTVTTGATGRWNVWFTTPKSYWVRWSDNANTAYAANRPTVPLNWTTFVSEEQQAFQPAGDEATDDASFVAHVALATGVHGESTGTFAARPAAGVVGRRYVATFFTNNTLTREYYDTGTEWVCLADPPGTFNPLDYGADPAGLVDSTAAFQTALTKAATYEFESDIELAGGRVISARMEVSFGVYILDGTVTIPAQATLSIHGMGGQPLLEFASGHGFAYTSGTANNVKWRDLAINGSPAIYQPGGATAGQFKNCNFRSRVPGTPALQLTNVFWAWFDNCGFRSANNATPSIIIESSNTPNMLGWLLRWRNCIFDTGNVRWDCATTHTTVLGSGVTFDGCDTENFSFSAPEGALLHIRNTHATQDILHYGVEFRSCTHNDGGSDWLDGETLGTGRLTIGSVTMINSDATAHFRAIETGGGKVGCNKLFIQSQGGPGVVFGVPDGNAYMSMLESGWKFVSDRASVALRAGIDGEAQDRIRVGSDARIARGYGSATPTVTLDICAGTPEGSVTAAPGSFAQDTTNGVCYIKNTGTGNTGWVKVLGFTPGGALTQTYSTADATLGAYTSDPESSAYTGIDNLQAATPYATVANLNALRVAYETLRVFTEDLAAFTNSLVDKLQTIGLVG